MSNAARVFDDQPAVRESVPLLIGLDGPSGSGKTYSALRMASGIQRVTGGDVFGIDTESNRMKHYADEFKFRHVPFRAPFSPMDYLAAIEHCVKKGAKTIIVDSMSHEHEGPGGVLDMHEREVERMAGSDRAKAERVKMLAWGKPKQQRRQLINAMLQINANFIFCFRAKEKVKVIPGKEPEQLGFMPIAGDEFVFEMTLCCLLLPGSRGVPTWNSNYPGERLMMKLPGQFEQWFKERKALDESLGEQLAKWAAGGAPPSPPTLSDYETCESLVAFDALEKRRADAWSRVPTASKAQLKDARDAARKRLQQSSAAFDPSTASERLNAAKDMAALDLAWDAIAAGYQDLGRDIPLDMQTLYSDRKAELQL